MDKLTFAMTSRYFEDEHCFIALNSVGDLYIAPANRKGNCEYDYFRKYTGECMEFILAANTFWEQNKQWLDG